MADYNDYVKGGDILIAPTVHFKHRFILKCSLCDEYNSEFEEFFSHYLSHNDREFCEETPFPPFVKVHKLEHIDEDEEGNSEVASNKEVETQLNCMDGDQEDVALMKTEKIYIKEENTFQETDGGFRPIEVVMTDGPSIENVSNPVELANEDEMANEATDSKNGVMAKCVRYFMKSKRKPIALIEAYKNQPMLWNVNIPPSERLKERENCVEKIAGELNRKHNLNLTCDEVSAIIAFIRQKYKEKLGYLELGDLKNSKDKSLDYLEHLSFLKPFMENNAIAVITDDMQKLTPEKISQILCIYKRFPHLWDSNLVEYVCTNKRAEALEQMTSALNTEMSLEVEPNLLENYIKNINAYCSKEKRRDVNAIQTTEKRPEYYEHVRFLYNHVAPFKCATCYRDFRHPLYYKEHLIVHDSSICFQCTECGKIYKSATLYMEHARRHMNDLTKICKVCGRPFLKTRDLNHHMRIHTGDKPYVCDICGKGFRQAQTFTEHKRAHNKDYVHFCSFCSKGFYTKSSMNVHVATHKTERNHVCTKCNKAFKTKINLTHHEWTHEDGCYPCEFCGKTYKNKYSLYQHTKNHRKYMGPV